MGATETIAVKLIGTYKDGISDKMDSTKGAITGIGVALAVVTAAAAATATALYYLTSGAASAGDEIDKMSERLGVTPEYLSAMGYAAELSGASLRDIEMAIRSLARNAEAAEQGLEAPARAFASIGVEYKDMHGKLKDAERLFSDVQEGLRGLESETKKSAAAQQLMGRSGTALIPLLNQTTGAIKSQMDEAERMGVVYTEADAKMSAAFVDAETKVKAAITGVRREIAEELMPIMTTAMDDVAEFLADNRDLFEGIGGVLDYMIDAAYEFLQSFDVEQVMQDAEDAVWGFKYFIKYDLIPVLKEWEDTAGQVTSAVNAIGTAIEAVIWAWKSMGALDRAIGQGIDYVLDAGVGEVIPTPTIDTPTVGGDYGPSFAGMGAPAMAGGGGTTIIHQTINLPIQGIVTPDAIRYAERTLGPVLAKAVKRGRLKWPK